MNLLEIESRLFEYKNERLLRIFTDRYLQQNCCPELKAETVFVEFKKFIYVIYLVQAQQVKLTSFTAIQQLEILDQFWHQFILMTSDYHSFCEKVFGCYIHHEPESNSGQSYDQFSDIQNEIKKQIDVVQAVWGISTAQTWFVDLPRKKMNSKISRIIKKAKLLAWPSAI